MEKLFEFEQTRDPRIVMFSSTKLISHASLWWDRLQLNRECSFREKIKTQDRMVLKMKRKFLLVDYALNLFKGLHNLKQLKMPVKEYIEEFYKISIRVGQNEESLESISRYVNDLSYAIQDEFNVLNFLSVAKDYPTDLRIEEKLLRK